MRASAAWVGLSGHTLVTRTGRHTAAAVTSAGLVVTAMVAPPSSPVDQPFSWKNPICAKFGLPLARAAGDRRRDGEVQTAAVEDAELQNFMVDRSGGSHGD
jgi:hypothetical protein